MFNLPREIALFDIECTTWKGAATRNWSRPGEHREIVQLGAAIVETKSFTELEHFDHLVKPTINPKLSDYFIDLTGITQEQVDNEGVEFLTFLSSFYEWCGDRELYCFDSRVDGSRLFDLDVLQENCALLDVTFPFEVDRFHNVNLFFYEHGYEVKQSGSAPEALGIKLQARPHNAINDVRGLIIGLEELNHRLS